MSAQPVNPNLPPDHVTVFIDGVELAAPKNSMIIHAADKAGIPIPRFCYHEKLPIAANCRMCLVEAEMGGRMSPKPLPACATPVADGMKVFTRSEKALKSQRNVMEFLLINHPLDCPICDQGGECELQDVSVGYGRGISRYSEKKRVVADEDLGPLVATEMTRCIQCTRCIRFTAEVAGTYELGGMQRGENLQIGTFDGKPLTTELSGNVIDVCPVGALTNKVFQFKARPWELVARDSLGFHDALGSNLFLHTRRGEVLRAVPRDNELVNECWLSDRDRYAHQGMYADDRALAPMIRVAEGGEPEAFREATWDEALAKAAEILRENAGDSLGVLVHPATSNEEGALLARLAGSLGSGNLDHRLSQHDLSDAAVAEVSGVAVEDIEHAEVVVIVGSHLRHEVPLLHHRVRKAWKRGARVYAVNPVDFDFTFDLAGKAIVAPSQIAGALASLDIGAVERAVVIVGGVAENGAHASTIRAAVRDFVGKSGARVCRIPQGANAVGLARQGVLPSQRSTQDMLREARQAYVIYGIEPGLDFADQGVAMRALAGARTVAFSHYACRSTRSVADVILPIALLPELDATLTNLEGRDQRSRAAGKLRGEVREGWRVLRALGAALSATGFEFTDLAGLRAAMTPRGVDVRPANVPAAGAPGLELAVSQAIYRVDATVRRAAALQAHPLTVGECAMLHPETAAAIGLRDGAMGKFSTAAGTATLPVSVSAKVAPGVVWVESGYGATAPLASSRVEAKSA
ncbi:NADH dehydrogenase (quinone) subunit G [Lysobacter pythonis]|uniref:NADH-quinone oxidoreductase n=1 Tax=Solilutibacter pythonis TaxID=2483112 RepID=A0A3M2I451_9GAMM|nr:NADH-quinone oxidoreductase subunit NuoG [Lysobacter pythonis]RMH94790.1 NADH dehydrogenase (quinone) subunit G [Lysobacter pythonis]